MKKIFYYRTNREDARTEEELLERQLRYDSMHPWITRTDEDRLRMLHEMVEDGVLHSFEKEEE